jgi:hypothetical protein
MLLTCFWQPLNLISSTLEGLSLSYYSSAAGKALYSSISSSAIPAATLNWSNMPVRMNQRAACFALAGRERMSSILSVPHAWIKPILSYLGHRNRTWRTVCACHPQGQVGVISGTWTAASQAFRPITSVRIRNSAVASAFDKPTYSLQGSCAHRVRQTIAKRLAGSLRIAASYLLR